jgi:hypothetical protein
LRTATRFGMVFAQEKEHRAMNLRDHMTTNPGQFTLAESHVPLTVDMLSDAMLREEVTVYHVGQDASGRSKFHVYVHDAIHVATLVEMVKLTYEEAPRSQTCENTAVNGYVAVLH